MVDTGEKTMTGGRLKRVAPYVKGEDAFCLTYGDGLADVNISELIAFHKAQKVKATLTAILPPGVLDPWVWKGKRSVVLKRNPRATGR